MHLYANEKIRKAPTEQRVHMLVLPEQIKSEN